MGNVWSELRKQEAKKKNSVWNNLPGDTKPVIQAPPTPVEINNEFPTGTISFDLETGSVDFMFSCQDPGFIRLSGWEIDGGMEVQTTPDTLRLLKAIESHEGWLIGHNIMNFDNILLDKHHGLSILALAKADRLRDTKLIGFLADPPYSRMKEGEIEKMYSLATLGTKYLGVSKMVDVVTGNSVLKELAKKYGGFDKIPVDDPEYNEYLVRDVEVTRELCRVLPINDYVIREHKVNAVCSTISIQGFRVDIDLLEQRIAEGEAKRHRILTSLQGYGLPSPDSSKAPHRTKAGIEAINQAFMELDVTLPLTASGRPALGKDVLQNVIEESDNSEVQDLAEAILSLNGIRTIYANIHENLVGERVHPKINLRQSSGRLSITDPGLTVIGKRDGKVIERAVFLPDPGCVLISADLAQVDARAVAGLSQDTAYLELFEPGKDLHGEMAERLFGTRDKRELAKPVAHGINYGMRPKKLAWTTGMDLYDAEQVVYTFERQFPRLARWQTEVRQIGETTGILYNGFGRMMKIEKERAFTQAPALMGQSTARDILMEGVLRLWDMGGEDVIRMIRGIIHDELVMSVPVADVEEIEQLVVKAMSFEWLPVGGTYPVNIEAGLNKRGSNWAECYAK